MIDNRFRLYLEIYIISQQFAYLYEVEVKNRAYLYDPKNDLD